MTSFTRTPSRNERKTNDWVSEQFGSISLKRRPIGVSTQFRPLSTWVLRALEIHALNRVDTSWSPFNYYIQNHEQVVKLIAYLSKTAEYQTIVHYSDTFY